MNRAVIAIITILVAGCQYPSPSGTQHTVDSWQVLERVGDVRSATDIGQDSRGLRPGDRIAEERRVTVGKGGLLILARNGIQMTASEKSSVLLSAPGSTQIALDRGSLRLRIATAANSEVRVKSMAFDIHASRATLSLYVGPDVTKLSVDDGNAVLATTDGRHRASLVAGAAATIDQASGEDLLIRPAAGHPFAKVAPFSASHPTENESQPPTGTKISSLMSELDDDRSIDPPSAGPSLISDDLAIRPASRLKKAASHQTAAADMTATSAFLPAPGAPDPKPASPTTGTIPIPATQADWPLPKLLPKLGTDSGSLTTGPISGNASIVDPLQSKFDLLTAGFAERL